MKLPIYMDYAATTPVDPRVVDKMLPFLTEKFGNAASRAHAYGWLAESSVEEAREKVAQSVGADPREIVWTSGATESINLATKGAAEFYRSRGHHIISFKIEHKAVLDSLRFLETKGFSVTYLQPQPNGLINLDDLRAAFRTETILVSIALVHNEIGVIQPVAEIAQLCREKGVLLHVDAAQAIGKVPIDLKTIPVDLMSFSAHKAYGPKGIGALYVRRQPRVRLVSQIHGGGQERGFRSGTLPVHQIVGMGEAFAIADAQRESDNARARVFQRKFFDAFRGMEAVFINGDCTARVPQNINVSFGYVEGESLMMGISDVAVSSGSACTSASLEPSYVLRALGVGDDLAHSSIRLTTGRFTTPEEVDYVIEKIRKVVEKLRNISPLWEMHKEEGIDINSVQWQDVQ